MEGMLAEVRMFAGNFAPRAWAYCHGQLLAISSNSALFSLLGCTYGGDCRTTFALPDCRGRAVIGAGTGPGLTPRTLGQRGGQQYVTLTTSQIPPHSHTTGAARLHGSSAAVNTNSPVDEFPGVATSNLYAVDAGSADFLMSNKSVTGNSGNNSSANLSHSNLQPFLGMHFIICTSGIFPSRN